MSDEVFPNFKGQPRKKKATKRKAPSLLVECDKLFGQIVRAPGVCVSRRDNHKGAIQCAHGFSRRYRALRWDERNAWPLCQGCHLYFTVRPLDWDAWLRVTWGVELYEELRVHALTARNPDMTEVASRLRERLSEIEGRVA